jgi:hypothetical protein
MLGFSLARLSYLNIGGTSKGSFAKDAAPGEWYWYHENHYRIGITLHLATILPAGILMVFQFVPAIRYKALLVHRINGYTIILLVFLANAGALMIARRSFGGTLPTQAGVGTLVMITTISIAMAWWNIKKLQIEQHRAWMLRAMFYLGTIITLRLIMILSALITSAMGDYYGTMSCSEISFIYGVTSPSSPAAPRVTSLYPACAGANLDSTSTLVVVAASMNNGRPEEIGTSLGVNFGMAMWLALLLHAVGVEIYLALTPRETERLREVSYERQLERGWKNPGSAGTVVERWGDAEPWVRRVRGEISKPVQEE